VPDRETQRDAAERVNRLERRLPPRPATVPERLSRAEAEQRLRWVEYRLQMLRSQRRIAREWHV
jgi:hypothetical protein